MKAVSGGGVSVFGCWLGGRVVCVCVCVCVCLSVIRVLFLLFLLLLLAAGC